MALYWQSRHTEAETAFGEAIRRDPHYVRAYCELGDLLADRGRPDDAEAAYRRALAVIDVGNEPSLRAFAAAGYRPAGTMRVDRLRLGRRSSRFVTASTELRRRYAAAVRPA